MAYTDEQLVAIYTNYAKRKGWSTSSSAIQNRIEAWQSCKIGAMVLAIQFHETGVDGRPDLGFSVSQELWHMFGSVAGTAYKNADGTKRSDVIGKCSIGEQVRLVREPNNQHDPHAVKVCRKDGCQLGYLPRKLAGKVAIELSSRFKYNAVIREIKIDIRNEPLVGLLLVVAEPNVPLADFIKHIKQLWKELSVR